MVSELTPSQNLIMGRVRVVFLLRTYLASPLTPVVCALIFLFILSLSVSFGHVISNTWSHANWNDRALYALSSFGHTKLMVQILSAGTLIMAVAVAVRSSKIILRRFTRGNSLTSFSC